MPDQDNSAVPNIEIQNKTFITTQILDSNLE
jgi:hypothetical protein